MYEDRATKENLMLDNPVNLKSALILLICHIHNHVIYTKHSDRIIQPANKLFHKDIGNEPASPDGFSQLQMLRILSTTNNVPTKFLASNYGTSITKHHKYKLILPALLLTHLPLHSTRLEINLGSCTSTSRSTS